MRPPRPRGFAGCRSLEDFSYWMLKSDALASGTGVDRARAKKDKERRMSLSLRFFLQVNMFNFCQLGADRGVFCFLRQLEQPYLQIHLSKGICILYRVRLVVVDVRVPARRRSSGGAL